jgi:prepilin-type N-terminal cleavage/methylation domain-containing protein
MYRRHERAFTLVELAIVLVIGGLLIGGIWFAAAKVREGMNVYNAEKQLLFIVQRTREVWLSRGNVQGDYTALTQSMAQQEVFPGEMKRNPNVLPASCSAGTPCIFNSPWDSTSNAPVTAASFDGTTEGNAGRFFRIRFNNTPAYACTQLPTRFSEVVDDIKLNAVLINGTSYAVPLTVATAGTACNAALNTLTFQFTLRN